MAAALQWPEGPAPGELKRRLIDTAFAKLTAAPAVASVPRPLFLLIPDPPKPVEPTRLETELADAPQTWCAAWREGHWAVATFDAALCRALWYRFLEARVSDLVVAAIADPGAYHPAQGRLAELAGAVADAALPAGVQYAAQVFDWGELVKELP